MSNKIKIKLSEYQIDEILQSNITDKTKSYIVNLLNGYKKKQILIIRDGIEIQRKRDIKELKLKNKKDLIFNLRNEKAEEFRYKLIENQTNSEKVFKAKLKVCNIRYEFQKIIHHEKGFHIVDFYLIDYGIIIEIDGGYHTTSEQKKLDKNRINILNSCGYKRIKRYSNKTAEIIHEDKIKKDIKLLLKK